MSTKGAGRSQWKVNYGMIGAFAAITLIVSACGGQAISPAPTPYISTHPIAPDYRALSAQLSFPLTFNPNDTNYFQVDLRSADLTNQDLSGSIDALRHVNFDSKTKWPEANLLPAGFSPKKMMDIGKNPGLGIRKLHRQGITGKGIGIAVIDQGLLVDHIEYKDQLRYYEEIEGVQGFPASMHGPAVASLAVGKTAGVAPGADLYFISASPCMDQKAGETEAAYTVACDAEALRQVIAINQKLPDDRKIRVVVMAMGWNDKVPGHEQMDSAFQEARDAGLFVITGILDKKYDGFRFYGLKRDPYADPDDFSSYQADPLFIQLYYQGDVNVPWLLFPKDSRAMASPTGVEDYAFFSDGGQSWSIPYIGGVYALALQVKPDLTPEAFWEFSLQTGYNFPVTIDGKIYPNTYIIDPPALIGFLKDSQGKNKTTK